MNTNTWYKLEDRKPPEGEEVIFYTDEDELLVGWWMGKYLDAKSDSNGSPEYWMMLLGPEEEGEK